MMMDPPPHPPYPLSPLPPLPPAGARPHGDGGSEAAVQRPGQGGRQCGAAARGTCSGPPTQLTAAPVGGIPMNVQ